MIGGTTTLEELISSCTVWHACSRRWTTRPWRASRGRCWRSGPGWTAARLRLLAAVGEREAYREDGARDAVSWLAWRAGSAGPDRAGAGAGGASWRCPP